MRVLSIITGLLLCSACAPAPYFATMEPGETGRVVRIADGDTLYLHTGQSVRLAGIEAPSLAYRARAAAPFSDQSRRMLEDLAQGRDIQLYYPGLTRDRYQRALAHAVTIDEKGAPVWLNQAMLERGGAWVRLYPDTDAEAEALFRAEAAARSAGLGLWGESEYSNTEMADLTETQTGFVLVTGTFVAAARPDLADPFGAACIARFQNSSIRVFVAPDAAEICSLPAQTRLHLRGWLRAGLLRISHHSHWWRIAD